MTEWTGGSMGGFKRRLGDTEWLPLRRRCSACREAARSCAGGGPRAGGTLGRLQRRWRSLATILATGSSDASAEMGRHTSKTNGRVEVCLKCGRRSSARSVVVNGVAGLAGEGGGTSMHRL
ncbi:hypothetical protein GQ55_3G163500 [Panicum hallii var. hallii]|uniref:Uncharacterized protein n=1 Tax=Panicum hallii var. hallii TaxID=1504633 RepID=A0A2T7EA28_9POAL|nr:hypothetical protein GQ55_3G163500 [Panicum hallii var. hallii]